MRNSTTRNAAALLIGLLVLAGGCAMEGNYLPVLTLPSAHDDADQRAYALGHQLGRRDDQRELRADYRRHHEAYDVVTEPVFEMGYRDGYAGRPSRYASTQDRGWYQGDDDEYEDQRARVSRGVPDWLVGDYHGWHEAYQTDVALTVYPDAKVVLVSRGKTRQGVYRSGRVHLKNANVAYAVTQARHGIRFTQVGDAHNTVYLKRTR